MVRLYTSTLQNIHEYKITLFSKILFFLRNCVRIFLHINNFVPTQFKNKHIINETIASRQLKVQKGKLINKVTKFISLKKYKKKFVRQYNLTKLNPNFNFNNN